MNWADREYAIGRGIAAIRHKHDERIQPFVRAVIKYGLPDLLAQATGSTFPSVSSAQLAAVPYPDIDLDEQRAIAGVLGALDDKIEQNRRTVQALERLARAIFRAWFVDFESVKAKAAGATAFPSMPQPVFDELPTRLQDSEIGPVPEGWRLLPLYEAAQFINGAAFKNTHFCAPGNGLPVVKIAELKGGITDQTKFSDRADLDEKFEIDTGEILYSWSGSPDTSLDVFVWTKGRALLNQHIFRVVTHSDAQKHFVYYLLKHLRRELIEIAKNKQTTGLGHVTVADMRRLKISWPAPDVLDAFEQQVGPIYRFGFALSMESESLTRMRDYLLPKLLSRAVRVKDAERFLEAAQ
jgi:type I restriction enzyme S subunit